VSVFGLYLELVGQLFIVGLCVFGLRLALRALFPRRGF
jgi:hypothetical protein